MRIEVVLPTLNRTHKLLNAIGSIAQATNQIEDQVWVYVYYSNKEEFERDSIGYRQHPRVLTRLLEKPYNASEFWNDHLKESHADIVIYLNDDVVLSPTCLKNTIDSMNRNFPDLDGIIGIKQEGFGNIKTMPSAFGAIGSKFMDRFPDRKVFCENYKRFFLDEELYLYSTSINKFHLEETATLIHCHPCLKKEYEDETHFNVRIHLNKDKIMFNRRQSAKLLWGESFELI
jgi:glycosyltransferase involved in cell wall biosynthesis